MPLGSDGSVHAAVVDVGSNSVRLVLYRLEGAAIWTVYNEKVLAGLGRDLPETGRLSEPGAVQALAALRRFAAVLESAQPDRLHIAATAAVREASDGLEFAERVAAETGLHIDILSGEAEARAAAWGVRAGDPRACGLVADLGGSSLELIELTDEGPRGGATLPLGPFALPEGLDDDGVRDHILGRLKDAPLHRGDTLIAVGGAWRSLAQFHMERTSHPLRIVHQYELPAAEMLDTARLVAGLSPASLERSPGVTRRRAPTLPHAAVVLEALTEHFGISRMVFSAFGLREGLLYQAMDEATRGQDPLLAGAAALGRRQGAAENLGRALIGWIGEAFRELPPAFGADEDRRLVEAACLLSDVGARLHPDHRADMVHEQVLRAPIPGQTHAERAFLAAALNARYGGPSATPWPEGHARLLAQERRHRARTLGLALRLGCDLSGRSASLLAQARLSIGDEVVLRAARGFADVLLGEQTTRRAEALARHLELKLKMEVA
ncbi:Ppx/GppA phosphatase family protein [Brevundimonas sp. 2R-24]|uniref:Ppx/GppA phosphatase family protein n=1 Tax=Peiella sedimenti TaxID=3061083 RepID=A0ABT8SJV3_9CAUL|nr:Ppx/GppA phosphatase family protein [Caulobacteraceae bacterium XZ-24]